MIGGLAERVIGGLFTFTGACWLAAKWIDHDMAQREAARIQNQSFLHLLDEPRYDQIEKLP